MAQRDDTADRVIARIAGRGYGVVTRRALLAAGITPDEIRHRLGCGALIHEHRGVYRVGHCAPDLNAAYLAAVYACGEGAVLGGLAAAHRYGLIKRRVPPEVHAPIRRKVAGVTTRRARLDARDTAIWHGIPTVTVPRALVDVAGRLGPDALARACHEAGVRFRTTPRQVDQALSRQPNARGAARLRAVLSGDIAVTLSRLEKRFLELLRAQGLPLPVTNKPAGSHRVDCRWPAQRLTVELDSYRYHGSRHAWEQDRRREREAYARGDAFRRYTYGDVWEYPEPMIVELGTLL